MIIWAKELKHSTWMRWNGLHNFNAKIHLEIESGKYILKTAQSSDELIECFKLRHEVFYQEFQGIDLDGLDYDKFDSYFDHLIIVQKDTKKIVGTYRVNCSEFNDQSYTRKEFEINQLLQSKLKCLELGRACIHKEHRKGIVLSLLWKGIVEYMNYTGSEMMFGCTSIKVNSTYHAAMVYTYLKELGAISNSFFTMPTKKFQMSDFDFWNLYFKKGLNKDQVAEVESFIPPLLKSYLKYGAKICSEPAFDKEFDCIDLLTVLNKEDIANSLARKFQLVQ